MKTNNKYELAVFEDEDKANLVEYSEKMQQSIEKALDNNKGEKGDTGEKGSTPIKGTDYFTEQEIQAIKNSILSQVNQFNIQVVQQLPTGKVDTHTIYFVPKASTKQNDIYEEYIYINNSWEHIGTLETNLIDYYTKDEINDKISNLESTEWQNATLYSGVTGFIRYRKQGKRVYVEGTVTTSVPSASQNLTQLPTEYRAKYQNYTFWACSGARICRGFAQTDGRIVAEWVKNISDASNYTSSTWINVRIDYDID